MRSRIINKISIAIFLLIIPSTLISILFNDIYQDGEWANAQWLAQDMVTLFVAIPLFVASYFNLKKKTEGKWKIVQTGILLYFTYTYTFFVFEAQLTWLYLFHLPIFGLALAGLVLNLFGIFADPFYLFKFNKKIKWIVIAYQSLIALMLIVLWLSDIFAHLERPEYLSDTFTGAAPLIIYTLDIGIIVPLLIISLTGFWSNKQYGILLTGIMLIKSSTLGLSLMAMSISLFVQDIHFDIKFFLLWSCIGCVGSLLTILFFKKLQHVLPLNPRSTNISIEFQEYQLN